MHKPRPRETCVVDPRHLSPPMEERAIQPSLSAWSKCRARAVSLSLPGRFAQAVVGWDVLRKGFFLKCFRSPTLSIESTAGADVWMTGLVDLTELQSVCAARGVALPKLVRLYLLSVQSADEAMLQTLAESLTAPLCP